MNALEAIRDMNELTVYMMQSANERESLKAEIERLKGTIAEIADADADEACVITKAESKYFESLKEKCIRDMLTWAYRAEPKDGEKFSEWAKRQELKVPDFMSKEEFIDANLVQLQKLYLEKKVKAESKEEDDE